MYPEGRSVTVPATVVRSQPAVEGEPFTNRGPGRIEFGNVGESEDDYLVLPRQLG